MGKVDFSYALETSYPEEQTNSIWALDSHPTRLHAHSDPVVKMAAIESVAFTQDCVHTKPWQNFSFSFFQW